MTKTKPGRYYGVTKAGRMVEITGDPPQPADTVICRRVADFPNAQPPAGAAIAPCSICGAALAYNPQGKHPELPRRCMQCAQIRPLPIED